MGNSEAYSINDSGQMVGYSQVGGPIEKEHAFLWEGDAMKDLGTLGGYDSIAYAINDAGQIVGSASTSIGSSAFIWENGVMKDLNTLIPPNSGLPLVMATDINNSGWILGYRYDSNNGKYYEVLLKPNVVPEPASCVLLLFGGGAFFAGRRLRKKA